MFPDERKDLEEWAEEMLSGLVPVLFVLCGVFLVLLVLYEGVW